MPPQIIVCEHDEEALKCTSRFSDRFVYSNYFVPLELTYEANGGGGGKAVITRYQKEFIRAYYDLAPELMAELVPELDVRAVLEANGVTLPSPGRDPRGGGGVADPRGAEEDLIRELAETRRRAAVEGERAHDDIEHARELLRRIAPEAAESREALSLLEHRLERIGSSTSAVTRAVEDAALTATRLADDDGEHNGGAATTTANRLTVSQPRASAPAVLTTTPPKDQALDLLLNLLKSEVGYIFLDRTRIRPSGFALGEHLYSLSLAPAEEVVLEQKTFTKRSTTFEEQTEQERQLDIELSSSLSTELQEGFERQKNRSATSGLTAGANLGGNIYGVQVGAQVSYSKNLTDASSASQRRSVKESSTASQKVASKYRTAHKVDFKVSTETGFEQTSKRTVRNPNRFTPLHLEYFKMLRTLELSQERYGVRLCWAPCVRDPGFDFVERLRKGREEIMKRAEAGVTIAPKPTPPVKQSKPPKWVSSGQVEADQWGFWNDMSADYDITVTAPDGYVWDGNVDSVKSSLALNVQNVNRSHGAYVVGDPWLEGPDLKVKVHVGVDWVIGKRGSIFMTVGATFVANPAVEDPEYKKAWDAYQQALAAWQAEVNESLATARAAALEEADDWEAGVRDQFNPVAELMGRIVSHFFPPTVRDECWELDLWQTLFDWDEASWVAYPGWWNGPSMRDWTKDPADFINASWAKLYVPIKLGFESQALRWIYDKVIENPADTKKEKAFTKLVKELDDSRKKWFGDPSEVNLAEPAADGGCPTYSEKFICLGRWTEVMPTDGTHVEVTQGMTSARDDATGIEVDGATKLSAALVASHEQDVELKKKAVAELKEVNATVTIDTDGSAPD